MLGAFACAGSARPIATPHAADALPAEARAWVERTLHDLDLRHKVGQLVFPRVSGSYMPVGSTEYERVRGWIEDLGVGGLIETLGPPLEAAAKLNMLQRMADVPLLIAADMEDGPGQLMNGGVVLPWGMRNGGGTRFPPAMGVAATGDARYAWEMGRITAVEARAIGVHVNFAPVVDVNNNADNPIINTRSYGADPAAVARFASEAARGMQENGLLAVAKHFPGHGDTNTDSHMALPFIAVDRARADSVELRPYRAMIEAGLDGVMSAHIAFPALTGDSVPATLNGALMTDLLRDELGFDGLVITDALDMGAIVQGWGATEAPVLALEAGADMLLQPFPDDVPGVIDAIVAAVRSGRLRESRIDASVRRVLEAKARLGLHVRRTVDVERVAEVVANPRHIEWANEAASRSMTLVRDRDAILPLTDRELAVVLYRSDANPLAGRLFLDGLRARNRVTTFVLDRSADARTMEAARAAAASADAVIVPLYIRVGEYQGNLAVPDTIAAFLESLATTAPVVVVSFGNPYIVAQLPGPGTVLLAWGPWEVQESAAVRALLGESDISGRLPIPIEPDLAVGDGITIRAEAAMPPLGAEPADLDGAPGEVTVTGAIVAPDAAGMDAGLTSTIDSIVAAALADSVAPGVAVAVGRHGRVVHLRGYGRIDGAADAAPVTDSTLWDLASLTKVIATTTLAMTLVDEGRLSVDARLSRELPEWGRRADGRDITIGHLLRHDSGLPAYGPLWRSARGRRAYLERIIDAPLESEPGTRTVYSDYGIILLGLVIERIGGAPLDVLAQQRIFTPLGMRDTRFAPLRRRRRAGPGAARGLADRIAVTELDTVFRMRHMHGEVHDENAFAVGGVAGHAGLFSSARDLTRFAQMMLNGGTLDGRRIVTESTLRRFTTRQSDASSRALGWDTPDGRSSAGDWFSASSFGHTGFTGTSLWVDPERDVYLIVLTNRVNPTRENQRHIPLRRDLADAVIQAIRDQPVSPRAQPPR